MAREELLFQKYLLRSSDVCRFTIMAIDRLINSLPWHGRPAHSMIVARIQGRGSEGHSGLVIETLVVDIESHYLGLNVDNFVCRDFNWIDFGYLITPGGPSRRKIGDPEFIPGTEESLDGPG